MTDKFITNINIQLDWNVVYLDSLEGLTPHPDTAKEDFNIRDAIIFPIGS
jgi:hypothetical protein